MKISEEVIGKSKSTFKRYYATMRVDEFDYSKAVFTGAKKKIALTCLGCGREFEQQAQSHFDLGTGCKVCSDKKRAAKQTKTTEEFIEQSKRIHGDAFDYSETVYVNNRVNVTIKCNTCLNTFTQYPPDHCNRGCGCPTCGWQKSGWGASTYKDKRTELYVLLLVNGMYKIGITKRTVELRYATDSENIVEILYRKVFENGAEAWELENKVLREFVEFKVKEPTMMFKFTGSNEIITKNPVEWLERGIT